MRYLAILVLCASAIAQEHKISVQKYEVPKYPPIARQAHITGDVNLRFDVSPAGEVQNVQVVSGHPMLVRVSTDAISKWRFHCDDCKYAEGFSHSTVFSFRFAEGGGRVVFEFPDRITVYGEPAPVMGIVGVVRPRYFWLWKLVHPKSWHFHDYDHDWQDTSGTPHSEK